MKCSASLAILFLSGVAVIGVIIPFLYSFQTKQLCFLYEIYQGSSSDANDFKITSSKYDSSDDLSQIIQDVFGSSYTIADWNDLKALDNVSSWISSMNIADNQSFMVTRDGDHIYYGDRHYFVKYASDGNPGSSFMVHDKIENKLFLGSWDGSYHILAATDGGGSSGSSSDESSSDGSSSDGSSSDGSSDSSSTGCLIQTIKH